MALSRENSANGLSVIRFDYCAIPIRLCLCGGVFVNARDKAQNATGFPRKTRSQSENACPAPLISIRFDIQQRERAEYTRRIGRRRRMQVGLVEFGKAGD